MEKLPRQEEVREPHAYIPMTNEEQVTARHGLGRVFIARADEPERVCGIAHRVGYTGKLATDLAIYRLKIRREMNSRTITLPCFYVVTDGIFVEY